MLLSIVTAAFNEERSLPELYRRIRDCLNEVDIQWEWIVVDDHSRDRTWLVVDHLASVDSRVRGIRLARNSGSHTALTCGLHEARGDCTVVLAADLQDPPEVITALLDHWHAGAQVVWATRDGREGEKRSTLAFARLYYAIMRRFVGIQEMPATGADFFLIDRSVTEALRGFHETNVSLFALLTWMGFRQDAVYYRKQARLHGQSGWSLQKKLKLLVDSVTAFSYLPIRLMSYAGFVVGMLGFLYALVVIGNALIGNPASGWSSLMVVVLVLGGSQMIMMGILGEYLWRALDEARGRPRFLIEARTANQVAVQEPRELQLEPHHA